MFIVVNSIAFDENAFRLTVIGAVLSANAITLLIAPAYSFAESLGAIIFAVFVLENIIILASLAAAAIALVAA